MTPVLCGCSVSSPFFCLPSVQSGLPVSDASHIQKSGHRFKSLLKYRKYLKKFWKSLKRGNTERGIPNGRNRWSECAEGNSGRYRSRDEGIVHKLCGKRNR
jgi:hypothetical protein